MKKILASLGICSLFVSFQIIFPPYSYAAFCVDTKDFKCLEDVFGKILGVVVSGASIAFFIMILSGGFKWLTSSGDPKDLENAKGRITFAMFGLILMILIWFILKFLSEFTGLTDLRQLSIPN